MEKTTGDLVSRDGGHFAELPHFPIGSFPEQTTCFTEETLEQHDKQVRQEAIMEVIDEIKVDFIELQTNALLERADSISSALFQAEQAWRVYELHLKSKFL